MTRSTRFTSFCTFEIQLKNHEKRFWQASSGRSTRPGKRSYLTAAAMPGEVAKRGCTRERCSTSRSGDYADSNDNACDARHGARVVQKARCSEVRLRTVKSLFVNLLRESRKFSSFCPNIHFCTAPHSTIRLNFVNMFAFLQFYSQMFVYSL